MSRIVTLTGEAGLTVQSMIDEMRTAFPVLMGASDSEVLSILLRAGVTKESDMEAV